MNEKTQELTFGAMIVAIFGVLLLINRQTGGMFEGFFMFIFPIPMVAFSARYGWKDSLAVFVCTVLIAFFFGTFTGIFYAVSMSFIGMVYGSCIYSQRDMNRTLILIMILSAAAELLCTIALATVAGFDLNADILAMQDAMNKMLSQAGVDVTSGILSYDYLRRMYIITTGFVGAMEGLRREAVLKRSCSEYPAVRRHVRRHLPDLLRLHRSSYGLPRLSAPAQDHRSSPCSIPDHDCFLYPYAGRLPLHQRQSSLYAGRAIVRNVRKRVKIVLERQINQNYHTFRPLACQ